MQEAEQVPPVGRDLAIDATRGIAILAVVLFHVTRGFVSADWLPRSFALTFADSLAYSFHVPTFLLIAGYLAFPRAGDARFQLQRQSWFYHAYLLWSLVSWVLVAAMSGAVNNPMNLRDLLFMPIMPIQHFWFLLTLMLGIALLYVLRTPWMLLAGCLAAVVLTPWLHLLPAPLGATTSICMLLIGGLLRATGTRPVANLPMALICAVVAVMGVLWRLSATGTPELIPAARILFALSGCYVAYCCAAFAGSSRVGTALAYFGRHSLVIFLLHVIAGSGLRVILSKAVPGLDVTVAIVLVLAMSLAAPLIFEMMAKRVGAEALLGLRPMFFNKRATAAASEADGETAGLELKPAPSVGKP